MNKLELSGFINLINEIKESEETITISEFFDRCINKTEETLNINTKWFMELKSQIEEALEKYAIERNFSVNYILNNNRVERTENSLIVFFRKENKVQR